MLFLLSIYFLLSVCFSLSGYKRMRVHSELWKDGFLCARVPERKTEKGQGGLCSTFSARLGYSSVYGVSYIAMQYTCAI
jgi:hypothetical protein